MTLRYSATRGEIWNWYWHHWRRRLWPQWLLAGGAVVVCVLGFASQDHPLRAADYRNATSLAALLWLFFAIYPQLSFKSEERTLTIGPDGLDTVIGRRAAQRRWHEIAAVSDSGTHIVFTVTKSGNAFLVPYRAFVGETERLELLRRVAIWRGSTMEPRRI